MRTVFRFAAFVLLSLLLALPASACGPDSDCRIGERTYRLRMPVGHDGKTLVGAIVFAHGYRGSAEGVMGNRHLARMASELGIAVIAAQAHGDDWAIPGSPAHSSKEGVDEMSYFDQLVRDATQRFPIDRDRLLAAGFSAGGMMIWNLACHQGQLFAGFASIAGTFWRPEPQTCTTPAASIVHVHGTSDGMVPLQGRPVAGSHQGDVLATVAMYVRYGGFGAAMTRDAGNLRCEARQNASKRVIELCLFDGGHSFRVFFLRYAWQRLLQQ